MQQTSNGVLVWGFAGGPGLDSLTQSLQIDGRGREPEQKALDMYEPSLEKSIDELYDILFR